MSNARLTKKKIGLSSADPLMKDVHNPKNGAFSVPHKKFETDSNDSQEDVATTNHVKPNNKTTRSEQLSTSKSKAKTIYKKHQYAKLEKETNRAQKSIKTMKYES
jgi:hypothetical protein